MDFQVNQNRRILIVDDAATTREWSRTVLQKAGFDVTTTDNPVLVPSMIFREKYDLVLLDVSMPLLDGNRVAEIMRGSGVPSLIVLLSSRPEQELAAIAAECGADGHLQKCSDPALFVQQVSAFFQTE